MNSGSTQWRLLRDVVDRDRVIELRERETTWRTPDGAPLAVVCQEPVGGPTREAPVILVHGLRGTRHNWRSSTRSFQAALVDAGYRVHCPELRGSGASRRAGSPPPRSILELVELDLSPLVERVADDAGHPVVLIGHSLGGIVSCLVASQLASQVAAVVAVASPLAVGVDQPLMRFGASLWVSFAEAEPFRELAHGEAMGRALISGRRLIDRLSLPPKVNSWLPGSMEPELEAEFLGYNQPEPAFPGLLRDLSRLAIGKSPEGMEIEGELARVRRPVLCIAADRDELAPIAAVRALHDALHRSERRWLEVGEDDAHLGHVDVLLGRAAPRLVWEPIVTWLDEKEDDGGLYTGR